MLCTNYTVWSSFLLTEGTINVTKKVRSAVMGERGKVAGSLEELEKKLAPDMVGHYSIAFFCAPFGFCGSVFNSAKTKTARDNSAETTVPSAKN